jgi:hypothetical protein
MGFGISGVAQEAYLSREAYRNKVEAYSQLLKQQRLKAAASTEARKIAQTGFLPKIDITAEGTANLNRLDDWNSPAGQYRPYTYQALATLGQPLYTGGSLIAQKKIAKADEVKELFSSFNGDVSGGLINFTMSSAPTFMVYADVKNGNALETLYKNKQSLGLKRGEDILELGKDEYVYKTKSMNIFYGIKDKQMYATNDELLYKNVGKAVDKSIKDTPYASDMKGKTVFMAINAEAILDLPVVKMITGFGGKEVKTYLELANKVSYLSISSEGETSEIDLCLKDKDVNALKQIVDFAKQFAGI